MEETRKMKQPFFKPTDTKEEQLEKLEYIVSELREIPSHAASLWLEDLIEKCIKLKFQGIELSGEWCAIFNETYRKIIMKRPINNKGNGCRYCGKCLDGAMEIHRIESHHYCSRKCRDRIKYVSTFGKKYLT